MLLLARSFGLGPVSRASMGHGFGHSRVLTAAVWSLFTTIATINDPECESSTVSPALLVCHLHPCLINLNAIRGFSKM